MKQHPVKEARTRKRMTQQHLADLCGVHEATICKIERGASPSLATIKLIAQALKISDYRKLLPADGDQAQ